MNDTGIAVLAAMLIVTVIIGYAKKQWGNEETSDKDQIPKADFTGIFNVSSNSHNRQRQDYMRRQASANGTGSDEYTRKYRAAQKLGIENSLIFTGPPAPNFDPEAAIADYIQDVTNQLDQALSELPQIPSDKDIFSNMPLEAKEALRFSIAPEVQRGVAQLTAQQMELICKYHEITGRLSTYLHTVKHLESAIPAGLRAELAMIKQLQDVTKESEVILDDPAWQAIWDIRQGAAAANVAGQTKVETKPADPQAMARIFLAKRARNERRDFDFLNMIRVHASTGTRPEDIPFQQVYEQYYPQETSHDGEFDWINDLDDLFNQDIEL